MAGCLSELAESRIGRAIAADSCDQLLRCLRQHENVFLRDKRDNGFLHYACTMHRPKVLRILLTTELNIDAQNKSGNTPLHITAVCNQSCMVPTLLMYGANPYLKNNQEKCPADIKTINGTWRAAFRVYETYGAFGEDLKGSEFTVLKFIFPQPGVFIAVERGDGELLTSLIRKWCKTDVQKGGRTLRQCAATRGFHHLLRILDRHKFTLECIYGVLEQNYDKFEKSVTKLGCDVNMLNEGIGHRHVIQYALEFRQEEMVTALCERGADVNMIINYKQYIKAPLYFSVLGNHAISAPLMRRVLDTNVNIHAKDERGRNAVMFAMDRAPAARVPYIVDFFLSRGLSIADRDDTGASVRNLGMLNDDKEIVASIDKMLIKLIRASEVEQLWRLAEDGYDDFFFEYLWKDSFIYAAGNDTDDVTVFLRHMQEYPGELDRMNHLLTGNGNQAKIGNATLSQLRDFLEGNKFKNHLLVTKDRAGRTPLTRAVMLGDRPLVDYLLSHQVCLDAINTRTDNLCRTSLHYAYCLREVSEEAERILEILLAAGAETLATDVCGLVPEAFSSGRPRQKLLAEMARSYGMTLEMHLLRKYKEMYKIITSKNKTDYSKYKKFLKISRNLWYPLSAMPKTLTPRGIPLVRRYRDLLFVAIDERHHDIVRKLVYLGADCDRQEWIVVHDEAGDQSQTLMTPAEYAAYRGLEKLAVYIHQRKLSGRDRTRLFHRALTTINDQRIPGFLRGEKRGNNGAEQGAESDGLEVRESVETETRTRTVTFAT